jgi:hypothetical protein
LLRSSTQAPEFCTPTSSAASCTRQPDVIVGVANDHTLNRRHARATTFYVGSKESRSGRN